MAPKYKNISAFDPYESRYDLSMIGNKLTELEEDQSKRIEATANIAGNFHNMWSKEQIFDTNKFLDIKDAQGNPIYEKSTNVFQDLYTPAGGRVSLTDAGKTATTPSILENQSYVPSKSAINKGGALLKPEMQDLRGATNIVDQTKEGLGNVTGKVKSGIDNVLGSNFGNLMGKTLAVGGIYSGIKNKDPLGAITSAIGMFNPIAGGLLSLGNYLSKRRR